MKTQSIVILAGGAALALYAHKALSKKADFWGARAEALPGADPNGASAEDRFIVAKGASWAVPAGIVILSAVAAGILLKS